MFALRRDDLLSEFIMQAFSVRFWQKYILFYIDLHFCMKLFQKCTNCFDVNYITILIPQQQLSVNDWDNLFQKPKSKWNIISVQKSHWLGSSESNSTSKCTLSKHRFFNHSEDIQWFCCKSPVENQTSNFFFVFLFIF